MPASGRGEVMRRHNVPHLLETMAVVLFFGYFTLSFLQIHLYNSDFWWHLANGRLIAETGALPSSDPFSYTAPPALTNRMTVILRGNWLSELVFYHVFRLWNVKGIIILRSFLLVGMLLILFATLRRGGIYPLLALSAITAVFSVALHFSGERPQLFTFVIFVFILYLIESAIHGRAGHLYFIPPSVMLAANLHPGFILCLIPPFLYLLSLVVNRVRGRENGELRRVFIVSGLSLAAAAMNPAGLLVVVGLLRMSHYTAGTMEFVSPLTVYLNGFMPVMKGYVILLALSVCCMAAFRRFMAYHLTLLAVFLLMSLVWMRAIIFFACVAAVVLPGVLQKVMESGRWRIVHDFFRNRAAVAALVTMVTAGWLLLGEVAYFARYEYRADVTFSVPEGAADFLSTTDIKGRMFNEWGFGGYLIWRLYPDKKVFIDGRALYDDVIGDYNIIIAGGGTGRRTLDDILRSYDISYVVMPPLSPLGRIYPIVEKLIHDDSWTLIYHDHLCLIFLKLDGRNSEIVRIHGKDGVEGLGTIVVQASARAMRNRKNPNLFVSIGKAFYWMKKTSDAEKAFLHALDLAPDNDEILEWLHLVRGAPQKG